MNIAKVLVLTSTYPFDEMDPQPGFVKYLSAHLAKKGFSVTVLAPGYPGVSKYEHRDGVNLKRYRYFFRKYETLAYGSGLMANIKAQKLKVFLVPFLCLGLMIALVRELKKEDWNVVHAHWIIPQGLVALVAFHLIGRQSKLLVTSHGGDLFAFRGVLGRKIKRWVLQGADHVTVVSHAMKEYCETEITVCKENISVIPMGVNLKSKFAPEQDLIRAVNSIVFVGRLVPKKGVSTLIRAFRRVLSVQNGAKLTIVGDGVLRRSLELEAKQLGVFNAVEFMGPIENGSIPIILSRHSIAVVPSVVDESGDQEGLGLTGVEAMGCECVVVASNLPAIKDVVTDGETGFVFTAGDDQQLAEKLLYLMANPDVASAVAKAGREFVLKAFDWESIVERYAKIILS